MKPGALMSLQNIGMPNVKMKNTAFETIRTLISNVWNWNLDHSNVAKDRLRRTVGNDTIASTVQSATSQTLAHDNLDDEQITAIIIIACVFVLIFGLVFFCAVVCAKKQIMVKKQKEEEQLGTMETGVSAFSEFIMESYV